MSELAVLAGLVLIGYGLLGEGARARAALLAGLLVASLAGLEQAAREHLAGWRSHSTLLAGPFGLLAGGLAALVLPYAAAVAVAAVVFGLAFWRLRSLFRARAGVAFRA